MPGPRASAASFSGSILLLACDRLEPCRKFMMSISRPRCGLQIVLCRCDWSNESTKETDRRGLRQDLVQITYRCYSSPSHLDKAVIALGYDIIYGSLYNKLLTTDSRADRVGRIRDRQVRDCNSLRLRSIWPLCSLLAHEHTEIPDYQCVEKVLIKSCFVADGSGIIVTCGDIGKTCLSSSSVDMSAYIRRSLKTRGILSPGPQEWDQATNVASRV
jgi:hypothetical protein